MARFSTVLSRLSTTPTIAIVATNAMHHVSVRLHVDVHSAARVIAHLAAPSFTLFATPAVDARGPFPRRA